MLKYHKRQIKWSLENYNCCQSLLLSTGTHSLATFKQLGNTVRTQQPIGWKPWDPRRETDGRTVSLQTRPHIFDDSLHVLGWHQGFIHLEINHSDALFLFTGLGNSIYNFTFKQKPSFIDLNWHIWDPGCLGSNSGSNSNQLCNFQQIT